MTTALDIDLAALVGDMPAVPCEALSHGRHPIHSDGPASHYVRSLCPACGDDSGIFAVCPGFVEAVRANVVGICPECGSRHHAALAVTILGPVGGSTA